MYIWFVSMYACVSPFVACIDELCMECLCVFVDRKCVCVCIDIKAVFI